MKKKTNYLVKRRIQVIRWKLLRYGIQKDYYSVSTIDRYNLLNVYLVSFYEANN